VVYSPAAEEERLSRRAAHGGGQVALLYEDDLTDLEALSVHASQADVVTWQGRRALKVVDGLVLVPNLEVGDASIEVSIAAEGPAYPGVAFRVQDQVNHELVYAVPHCSGLWDAMQYDSVFHGSNTWQLYHGPSYQSEATIPTGEWFRLRVDVEGDRASFTVGDQPPLFVGRLARGQKEGLVGVWTFRPAYFTDLRVSECEELPGVEWQPPAAPEGLIDEWFVEGFGVVRCEPGGVLNLNRYLPISTEEATLTRQFEALSDAELQLGLGFSDELALELDDETIFQGTNTFAGFGSYEERGYAHADMRSASGMVSPGVHKLTARLKVTEGFGWGLVVSVRGQSFKLLPARLG
jgi:hypothetical protein